MGGSSSNPHRTSSHGLHSEADQENSSPDVDANMDKIQAMIEKQLKKIHKDQCGAPGWVVTSLWIVLLILIVAVIVFIVSSTTFEVQIQSFVGEHYQWALLVLFVGFAGWYFQDKFKHMEQRSEQQSESIMNGIESLSIQVAERFQNQSERFQNQNTKIHNVETSLRNELRQATNYGSTSMQGNTV